MPFDSNGNFSLVPGTIVSDGMTIQPSQHNPPLQDFAAGLSMVVVRDGRSPMTGPLNMNGNRVTGAGDAIQQTDLVNLGQVSSALYEIGDFKDTARTLDPKWLRRNGERYSSEDYPDLSLFFPPLPGPVDWTIRSSPPVGGALSALASSTSRIVAVGQDSGGGSSGVARWTDDGESWNVASVSTTHPMFGVAWGSGMFVAGGATGVTNDSLIRLSSNGSLWSDGATLSGISVRQIAFHNGFFYAAGEGNSSPFPGFIQRSANGTSWTQVYSGTAGGTRIIVGNGILIGFGVNTAPGGFVRSTDGLTWTSVSGPTGVPTAWSFGNGRFIFIIGGTAHQTTDGLTWQSYPAYSAPTALAYSEGFGFVGVGAPQFSVSGDASGQAWETYDTPSSFAMNAIIQFPGQPGRFIAVGGSGAVIDGQHQGSGYFHVPDDDPEYGWIKAL